MDVPSLPFLGFALVGAALFNAFGARWWQTGVFFALNALFFATYVRSPLAVAPYAAFLLTGYAGVAALSRRPSRALFVAFLAGLLVEFFVFKRYAFVPTAAQLPFAYATIGLSYVFFRVLHLVIDAQSQTLAEAPGPVTYLNYTMNFTSLVAGPIQLYPEYRQTTGAERPPLDLFAIARAAERIIVGLFKVVVVAGLLHQAQLAAVGQLAGAGELGDRALLTAAAGGLYPLFLYANFSGYTDFVIGVARLFRLVLPENFDRPFTSESFIEFWSRWHITLSRWLRTYVYTPLLMTLMRRVPSPAAEPYLNVLAYFATFFLVGAWHGQTAMFLFFGVLQGGGVAGNKLFQILMAKALGRKGYRELARQPIYRALARGLTFTWFAFTLLWFWCDADQLASLFGHAGAAGMAAAWALVLIAATLALAALAAARDALERRRPPASAEAPPPSRYWRTAQATAMALVFAVWTALLNGPAPDIVYRKF